MRSGRWGCSHEWGLHEWRARPSGVDWPGFGADVDRRGPTPPGREPGRGTGGEGEPQAPRSTPPPPVPVTAARQGRLTCPARRARRIAPWRAGRAGRPLPVTWSQPPAPARSLHSRPFWPSLVEKVGPPQGPPARGWPRPGAAARRGGTVGSVPVPDLSGSLARGTFPVTPPLAPAHIRAHAHRQTGRQTGFLHSPLYYCGGETSAKIR